MPVMRNLEARGEMDYDYSSDILFFKIKNREYSRSLEFENMVIDIDAEDFIVGLQILNASKFLNTSKIALMKVPKWRFQASITNNKIELRLAFQVIYRNKPIQMQPIILTESEDSLPNSKLVATMA